MYDSRLRHPVRKRCAGCRSYFGFTVVFGLFCSRACAGVPEVWRERPEDWPRQHYSVFRRGPGGAQVARSRKREYMSEAEAVAACWGDKQAYRCQYCALWHIGGRAPSPFVTLRGLPGRPGSPGSRVRKSRKSRSEGLSK